MLSRQGGFQNFRRQRVVVTPLHITGYNLAKASTTTLWAHWAWLKFQTNTRLISKKQQNRYKCVNESKVFIIYIKLGFESLNCLINLSSFEKHDRCIRSTNGSNRESPGEPKKRDRYLREYFNRNKINWFYRRGLVRAVK